MRLPTAGVLLLFACTDEPDDPQDQVLEIATPLLQGIEPGADVMLCSYLDEWVEADADVVAFSGAQTEFGHHAILFEARLDQAAGTHPCDEADMVNVRHLATIGGEGEGAAFELPEGVTFRMHADHQLMVQTHWVNSSDAVIDGRASFALVLRAPSPERSPADLFTVLTTDVDIPPGGGRAQASCTLPVDVALVAYAGHAHDHATRVTIHLNDEPLYDEAWTPHSVFAPRIVQHEAGTPLSLHPGDRVDVECLYQNETSGPLRFPKEMCAMLGFYFPSEGELDCVNGVWNTNLSAS